MDSEALKGCVQVFIPDDVMAVKAYILWKDAGEPDGADFSHQARSAIADELAQGLSLDVRPRRRRPCLVSVSAAAGSWLQPGAPYRGARKESSLSAPPGK